MGVRDWAGGVILRGVVLATREEVVLSVTVVSCMVGGDGGGTCQANVAVLVLTTDCPTGLETCFLDCSDFAWQRTGLETSATFRVVAAFIFCFVTPLGAGDVETLTCLIC